MTLPVNSNSIHKAITAILIIAVVLFIRGCHGSSVQVASLSQQLDMYKGQVSDYTIKVNKYGETISTQSAIISEKNRKLEDVLLAHSNLKELNDQIKIDSDLNIKNIIAQYSDKSPHTRIDRIVIDTIHHDTISITVLDTSCITVGSKFSLNKRWYTINGSVQKNGVLMDSLSFIDSLTVNIGLDRTGFFRRKSIKVEAIHANPDYHTTGMQSIIFKEKVRWYDKRLNIFGVGVGIGIIALASAQTYLFH